MYFKMYELIKDVYNNNNPTNSIIDIALFNLPNYSNARKF